MVCEGKPLSGQVGCIVPVPTTGYFLLRAPALQQLSGQIRSLHRLNVPIAKEQVGPGIMQIERPLPFFIHPDETAPIRVAFSLQIPIAIPESYHVRGFAYGRNFCGAV